MSGVRIVELARKALADITEGFFPVSVEGDKTYAVDVREIATTEELGGVQRAVDNEERARQEAIAQLDNVVGGKLGRDETAADSAKLGGKAAAEFIPARAIDAEFPHEAEEASELDPERILLVDNDIFPPEALQEDLDLTNQILASALAGLGEARESFSEHSGDAPSHVSVGDRIKWNAAAPQEALNTETANRTQADADERQARMEAVDELLYTISKIVEVIPEYASALDVLATHSFVNSSVANAAANMVTPDEGGTRPWDSLAELITGPHFYQGNLYTPRKNDYATFINQDPELGPTGQPWRARFDGAQWIPDFPINNSTLTAEQYLAINSGITETLVNQIGLNLAMIMGIVESLSGKLGITATAADSAKLGGKAASAFIPATAGTFADEAAAVAASTGNPTTLILADIAE